jgi:hypothetical protein
VSALAQLIELRGIPTTVIGLVRLHMEKVPPPRGLWTPFQLGRPIGEPEDRAFQTRVVMQALKLLERTDGPVILEDFPDDPPSWTDLPGWSPSFTLPAKSAPASPDAWRAAMVDEIAAVAPAWPRATRRFGHTTVGVSTLPPHQWAAFMAAFLAGELPASPSPHIPTPALALRFAIDDLKAFYYEAAQADGAQPAARQIDAWFWHETLAGDFLRALRTHGMASENNALKTVAGRFFVPAPWLAP